MLQEMMEREETASSFGVTRVGTSWEGALGGEGGVPENMQYLFLFYFRFSCCLLYIYIVKYNIIQFEI